MKEFDKLYALDKKGKIRVFEIFVDTINGRPYIVSKTGLVHGKLVSKKKEITSGKNLGKANATTPIQQAVLEAQSKWNDKLDEGYKTDKMCQDRFGFDFKYCVNVMYIMNNTNTNWDEKPMLATPMNKVKKIPFPAYIQRKLNGVRCMAKLVNNKVILMSRGGKYYTIPHIQDALMPMMKMNPYIVFDGEIFNPDYSLQEISGAAREEAGEKDKSFLEYHIYDIANNEIQGERIKLLSDIFHSNSDCVKEVLCHTVQDKEDIKFYHDTYVNEGYEGAIVRPKNGKYHFGFRDKDLIKVKEFIDEEFKIIGCKVSDGQSIGDSFVFELQNNTNNGRFFARPKGTRQQKEHWYSNPFEWMNEDATVRYQERTEEDIPHQAHVVCIRNYE